VLVYRRNDHAAIIDAMMRNAGIKTTKINVPSRFAEGINFVKSDIAAKCEFDGEEVFMLELSHNTVVDFDPTKTKRLHIFTLPNTYSSCAEMAAKELSYGKKAVKEWSKFVFRTAEVVVVPESEHDPSLFSNAVKRCKETALHVKRSCIENPGKFWGMAEIFSKTGALKLTLQQSATLKRTLEEKDKETPDFDAEEAFFCVNGQKTVCNALLASINGMSDKETVALALEKERKVEAVLTRLIEKTLNTNPNFIAEAFVQKHAALANIAHKIMDTVHAVSEKGAKASEVVAEAAKVAGENESVVKKVLAKFFDKKKIRFKQDGKPTERFVYRALTENFQSTVELLEQAKKKDREIVERNGLKNNNIKVFYTIYSCCNSSWSLLCPDSYRKAVFKVARVSRLAPQVVVPSSRYYKISVVLNR
jgi:hypothetical protein